MSDNTGVETIVASQPNLPGSESEIDDETRRILDERLNATDEPTTDARQFIADLRERLRKKQPSPR